MPQRRVEIAVVSDLHLGTYASRAREFTAYLKSIDPGILILNGDIIDGWQFSKRYFPPDHISAVKEIFNKLSAGTRIIYITGNHDDCMRRYSDLELGGFLLTDKIVIEINGKKVWIFHGDVFDHTTTGQAKFWGKLGSNGYAMLLWFNKRINVGLKFLGRERQSLSKKIMEQFNKRIINIDAFENKIAALAVEKKFDTVICGHIHEPKKKEVVMPEGTVHYLNSGDWVEHMTALEYYENKWELYTYNEREMKTERAVKERPHATVLTNEVAFYLHALSTVNNEDFLRRSGNR